MPRAHSDATFAEMIRTRREARGLSVRELADAVGVSIMTVYRWQEGRSMPHPYLRERVMNAVGTETTLKRGNR